MIDAVKVPRFLEGVPLVHTAGLLRAVNPNVVRMARNMHANDPNNPDVRLAY